MENSDTDQSTDNVNTQKKQFEIKKIYIKDISYEAPGTPQLFTEEWTPSVKQDIVNTTTQISDTIYEISIRVTLTVKLKDKIAFLTEVNQAGIFEITGYEKDELEKIITVFCPTLLLPYVRESISSISTRGGFPTLYLQHVDFEVMYNDYKKQNAPSAPEIGNNGPSH